MCQGEGLVIQEPRESPPQGEAPAIRQRGTRTDNPALSPPSCLVLLGAFCWPNPLRSGQHRGLGDTVPRVTSQGSEQGQGDRTRMGVGWQQ